MKRLTKHGTSLAVVIDKPILTAARLSLETPVELRVVPEGVLIVRHAAGKQAGFDAAALRDVQAVLRTHRRAFAELAQR